MKKSILFFATAICSLQCANSFAQGPIVTDSSTNATCFGQCNGTATAYASGQQPFTYSWTPGGETTQAVTGLCAGTYIITVHDAVGNPGTATVTITQPTSLTATAVSITTICSGQSTTITGSANGGIPPYIYNWVPSSSLSCACVSPIASPVVTTSYTLTVADANGCTASSSVTVFVNPSPAINVSSTSYCVINPTQLMASGATTYYWSPSSGLSCTTCANPTANPSITTTYIATDANGCGAASITVNVPTSSFPQICMTSVDSTSIHNIIVWEKPGSQGTIDSFRIYRENASFFIPIVTLPYSHLSMYTDTASSVNPTGASYKYRISSISSSAVESALSNVHETMYLQVTQSSPPVANLTWTDYCGFAVTKYYIYRDGYNTGNWIKIDSANWGTNVFVDPSAPTINAAYKIEVIPQNPCIASLKNPIINSIALNSSRSNVYRINNANAVNEISLNDLISIYPNPTSGQFNLKMNQFEDLKMKGIVIYNVYGAKVYSNDAANFQINSSSNFQINLSGAPAGIYFLQIKTPDGVAVKKIVKE